MTVSRTRAKENPAFRRGRVCGAFRSDSPGVPFGLAVGAGEDLPAWPEADHAGDVPRPRPAPGPGGGGASGPVTGARPCWCSDWAPVVQVGLGPWGRSPGASDGVLGGDGGTLPKGGFLAVRPVGRGGVVASNIVAPYCCAGQTWVVFANTLILNGSDTTDTSSIYVLIVRARARIAL